MGDTSIPSETNHERVAGLFALALASELARGAAGRVAALGDKDGIYLVAARIDETWAADVERLGVAHGHVNFVRHEIVAPAAAFKHWKSRMSQRTIPLSKATTQSSSSSMTTVG